MFKKYFTDYQSPSDMYKKLCETEGTRNENQILLIKEVLNRMKKGIKNMSKNRKVMIEEDEKMINIVVRILYFNQLDQSGHGLKLLTPNEMLSRLAISLAQLKAGNNSVKLEKQNQANFVFFEQIKKLTKNVCKSLIDII